MKKEDKDLIKGLKELVEKGIPKSTEVSDKGILFKEDPFPYITFAKMFFEEEKIKEIIGDEFPEMMTLEITTPSNVKTKQIIPKSMLRLFEKSKMLGPYAMWYGKKYASAEVE